MSNAILHLDAEQFPSTVLQAGQPVVVDFYSTECPPCEALAAKFSALAEIYGNDIRFVKIFRQGNRELAESLGVKSSPTLLFYDAQGQEVGSRLIGGIRRRDIEDHLAALLSPERVAELRQQVTPSKTECDVLIIGGGPAGLTAGLYCAQARFKTMVVDRSLAGGYVAITHQVSNFPGFITPQPGYLLAHQMSEQTKNAGVDYRLCADITAVDLNRGQVILDGIETIQAKKVVIATGSSPRLLGVKGEREYQGRGISYCATCDAKNYQDKHVVVIGGGNSAIEESLFIRKFAAKVTVVHQFDQLQANRAAQEKAFADPGIQFKFHHEPREFIKLGNSVGAVVVENLATGQHDTIECDGVFIFAGMKPNTELFAEQFTLDQWGYIKTDLEMRTNIPNVYAIGDVASKSFRQITTAVSDGTIAAMTIARELGS